MPDQDASNEENQQPESTILRLENQIKSLLATSQSAVANLENQIVILDEQLNKGRKSANLLESKRLPEDFTPGNKTNICIFLPDPGLTCFDIDSDSMQKTRIPLSGITNQDVASKFDVSRFDNNGDSISDAVKRRSNHYNLFDGLDGSDDEILGPMGKNSDLRLQLLKRETQLRSARENCELLESQLKAERHRCREHEAALAARGLELDQMRRYKIHRTQIIHD
jgi:hypothetical protein